VTRIALLALAVVALAACGRKPEPPQLPGIERPVLVLTAAAKTPSGVRVPRAAYVERAGVPGVFVLQENLARFRMVKAGRTQGADLEILSGLTGTETLVLGDLKTVRDGSPLQPLK
jgi:predicted small lipoprotein YifL